jgi:hypothetical protein
MLPASIAGSLLLTSYFGNRDRVVGGFFNRALEVYPANNDQPAADGSFNSDVDKPISEATLSFAPDFPASNARGVL